MTFIIPPDYHDDHICVVSSYTKKGVQLFLLSFTITPIEHPPMT